MFILKDVIFSFDENLETKSWAFSFDLIMIPQFGSISTTFISDNNAIARLIVSGETLYSPARVERPFIFCFSFISLLKIALTRHRP